MIFACHLLGQLKLAGKLVSVFFTKHHEQLHAEGITMNLARDPLKCFTYSFHTVLGHCTE